ncbi:DNA polymerase ligase-domain-containing protein [Aspergillus californicus]
MDTGNRRISTLDKPISPPPTRPSLSLSALEAGKVTVPASTHLQTISAHLRKYIAGPSSDNTPTIHRLLPIEAWKSLYTENNHPQGHHFVIHQHDHPIAGPHYDLRLQISQSSSVSWSIMYGLPGDPNSGRLSRNATETRVHCLWNHLIETASEKTGSMVIWDTGVYEILPDRDKLGRETEDEDSQSEPNNTEPGYNINGATAGLTESEKLHKAFQNHKIHLRLHGTRLPKNYTVFLHRDKSDSRGPATRASLLSMPRKRKRRRKPIQMALSSTSESDTDGDADSTAISSSALSTPNTGSREQKRKKGGLNYNHDHDHEHSDADPGINTDTDIDFQIRLHNAYPGSVNDIGSIHQRRWFVILDRAACGFVPVTEKDPDGDKKKRWIRDRDKSGALLGFDPFYVRGPEIERSVLTARLGGDVLRDEGVTGFIGRKGWRGVLN